MEFERDKASKTIANYDEFTVGDRRHRSIFKYKEVPAGGESMYAGDLDGCSAGEFIIGGRFAAACDIGFMKEEYNKPGNPLTNEDGYFKIEVGNKVFLCVGDGVGGDLAGEVACRIFLSNLKRNLLAGVAASFSIRNAGEMLQHDHETLRDSVHYSGEDTSNMGLCFTLAEIEKNKNKMTIRFHSCGDCRGYLKSGDLVWQTTDHTEAEKYDSKPSDVDFLEKRATVNRYVTLHKGKLYHQFFEVDHTPIETLREGDQIILATDGLWDCLPFRDTTMLENLIEKTEAGPDRQKNIVQNINYLIKEAILQQKGKIDNLAVIAAEF